MPDMQTGTLFRDQRASFGHQPVTWPKRSCLRHLLHLLSLFPYYIIEKQN